MGWTGVVLAEDKSSNVLVETITRQEMKNTPGRKNEPMPAFFQSNVRVSV